MLVIRFSRIGKKNKPQFKIVVQEHTKAPTGRHVEIVGSYDPLIKAVSLNKEKIRDWISKGAQPSPSVHNILVSQGVIEAPKQKIKLTPKKQKGEGGESQEEGKIENKAASGEKSQADEKKEDTKEVKQPKEEKPAEKEAPQEKTEKTEEKSKEKEEKK